MKNKQNSKVSEWNVREAETREAIQRLTLQLEELNTQRGELLLLIADGGDKTSQKGIEAIEKRKKDIELEIESLEALLLAIPKRRDLAQADEIESEIGIIEGLDGRLAELAARIDTTAESFVLAVRDYYDVLKMLYQINNHKMNFLGFDIGVFNSIGVFLRKYGLWGYIKVGHFRDAKTMTESPSRARQQIGGLLSIMREHVKQLRGLGKLPPSICPECYGLIVIDTSGKYACRDCYRVAER